MDLSKLKSNVTSSDLENAKLRRDRIQNPPQYEDGMGDDVFDFEEFSLGDFESGQTSLEDLLNGSEGTSSPFETPIKDVGVNPFVNNLQPQVEKSPEDIFFDILKGLAKGIGIGIKATFKFMKETSSKKWGIILSRAFVGESIALLLFLVLSLFGVHRILFIKTLSLIIIDIVLMAFTVLFFGFITDYNSKHETKDKTSNEKDTDFQLDDDFDYNEYEDSNDNGINLEGTIDIEDMDDFFSDLYEDTSEQKETSHTQTKVPDLDTALEDVEPARMYDRAYLIAQYKKVLPLYSPNYDEEKPIPEGSEEFLFIDTCCTKAINNISSRKLEDDENTYLVEAAQSKLYINAKMKRVKGLNRTDQIAQEIEPYFMASKSDEISVTVDIWGDFYDIKIFGQENFSVGMGDFLATDVVYDYFSDSQNVLPVVLGIDDETQPVLRDLKDLESLLIAGMARSGKSWVGLNIMTQLAMFNSPEDVQFIILDPKNKTSDFRFFSIPHHIAFCGNIKEFNSILYDIVETEAKRRTDIIGKHGETSIWGLRSSHPDIQLPIIYVYIDEVVTVAESMDKEEKEKFNKYLRVLVTKLPNLGIRTILVPHVAKHQFLDKTIKSVIPFRASVRGNADHIKSTLDLTSNKFSFELKKVGDMAMTIGSENPRYIKSGVITNNNEDNRKIFDYIGRLWKKKGYQIEWSSALRRVYEYSLDFEG